MSDAKVIYEYTLAEAIADGVLVELFKNRWMTLSGGKPIVVTAHLFEEVTLSGLLEIWNEYVDWRRNVLPTLPEEDQLYHTEMNGKTV
jgi:3'-phosphoadenosine 5'-phosphosulfate sulfotransferase (PAPS reductase)/FAD synthetase